jgi:hypothetical protein
VVSGLFIYMEQHEILNVFKAYLPTPLGLVVTQLFRFQRYAESGIGLLNNICSEVAQYKRRPFGYPLSPNPEHNVQQIGWSGTISNLFYEAYTNPSIAQRCAQDLGPVHFQELHQALIATLDVPCSTKGCVFVRDVLLLIYALGTHQVPSTQLYAVCDTILELCRTQLIEIQTAQPVVIADLDDLDPLNNES